MRGLTIKGYGTALPREAVFFGNQRRFRVSQGETQLTLAVEACHKALNKAGITIQDIDCLIAACAVGIQPIPCTAALIHEQIALGTDIPAMDINTTCTSFISALDMASYLMAGGRYKRILIVSAEIGSLGLNPHQKESYELFGDGAAAFIFEATDQPKGVLYSLQKTWSEGAHATEIRGGLTGLMPYDYHEDIKADFQFDMQGKKILAFSAKKLPSMFQEFISASGCSLAELDMIIPHQASRALPLIMQKLGVKSDQYLDIVAEYGNMVSASVPFALAYAMDNQLVVPGQKVALMGTAAGLTTNMLLLQL
ncbi:3-oxoacyl-[acyl-carrier-protein] synthase III C-terminal domain-containing protein [Streptococcus caprae]|uniref:3-oxoacyl-[acyl-carrier-protein] synthase III C-terminal domain-containing protein n=1 Tax=Streptococcus caprae TaxID=1640501 RepID=A0ABV8CUR5_9STRE